MIDGTFNHYNCPSLQLWQEFLQFDDFPHNASETFFYQGILITCVLTFFCNNVTFCVKTGIHVFSVHWFSIIGLQICQMISVRTCFVLLEVLFKSTKYHARLANQESLPVISVTCKSHPTHSSKIVNRIDIYQGKYSSISLWNCAMNNVKHFWYPHIVSILYSSKQNICHRTLMSWGDILYITE